MPAAERSVHVNAIEPPSKEAPAAPVLIAPGMTMAEIEKVAITSALAATKGNRRKAAEMLGIGERTMYRKLRDYGIPAR
jgi:DNA-binding NtrC family response regulator